MQRNDVGVWCTWSVGCCDCRSPFAEECALACAPFDGDVPFFEGLTIERPDAEKVGEERQESLRGELGVIELP